MIERHGGKYVLACVCPCGADFDLPCGTKRPAGALLSIARRMRCSDCADRENESQEDQVKRAQLERRVDASGLPKAQRGLTFDGMHAQTPDGTDRTKAISAARDWARMGDPGGLVLVGEVGCGKSRLAATAAWARLQHSPVRWVSLANLIAQLGRSFSDQARGEAVDVLTGTGGLVVDDIDKAAGSEWVTNQLFAAIDGRVEAESPLLVTTNLTPGELAEKFGAPIASRLVGYSRVVELAGPDYRTLKA